MRSLIAAILVRQLFNLRSAAAEANKTMRLDGSISKNEQAEAQRILESSPPRTLLCIDEAQGYAPPSKAKPKYLYLDSICKRREESWAIPNDYVSTAERNTSGSFVPDGLCYCTPANCSI